MSGLNVSLVSARALAVWPLNSRLWLQKLFLKDNVIDVLISIGILLDNIPTPPVSHYLERYWLAEQSSPLATTQCHPPAHGLCTSLH